jgi:anaerobic selenocysteine-containing dehydrogenase
LGWNAPAVAPSGQARSHTEIFRNLAAAMGLTEPELFASDDDLARAALSLEHPAMQGITLERLKADGWVRMGWPDPYLPFAQGFPTPSGRFEFRSERAEAAGLSLLPDYVVPREAASSRVGASGSAVQVTLISAANHYLVNSTFSGSRRHHKAGEPVVDLNPVDAETAGIVDGQRVLIANLRGSFVAAARVSDRVGPGVAATTKGLLPQMSDGPGSVATSVNATVSDGRSDVGGGALFHDNEVTVSPAPVVGVTSGP